MTNWTDSAAPRFSRPAPAVPAPPGAPLRVATFNLQFSHRLAHAAEVIRQVPQLAEADILALQEADERAVEHLADLVGAGFVYYPAVLHRRTGRNFGPAILSRWLIMADRKLILPHQQAAQARVVVEAIAHTGPAIVAGDLTRRGVGRVFEAAGWHWLTRRVGRTHLSWSFDHVFVRGIRPAGASVGSVPAALVASDHRAVWAELDLEELPVLSGRRFGLRTIALFQAGKACPRFSPPTAAAARASLAAPAPCRGAGRERGAHWRRPCPVRPPSRS